MLPPTFLKKAIVLTFMIVVGFSLAKSIQASSTLGTVLALVSLSGGIVFVYLLQKLESSREKE